jgi:hypothetical protein
MKGPYDAYRQTKNHALPLVRHTGRGGGEVLLLGLQGFQDRRDQPLHQIEGQTFTALNGGPNFKFSEAVSLQIRCETQAEVDYFWGKLTQGGEEGPCGWLKDKYGLSWQVVPAVIPKMMTDPDAEKSERVMNAFMKMKKLDIAAIERAYAGRQQ